MVVTCCSRVIWEIECCIRLARFRVGDCFYISVFPPCMCVCVSLGVWIVLTELLRCGISKGRDGEDRC